MTASTNWATPASSTSNRFFDVAITYAKAVTRTTSAIVVEATNHGPDAAPLHVLPQIWFRNTWAWGRDDRAARPCGR